MHHHDLPILADGHAAYAWGAAAPLVAAIGGVASQAADVPVGAYLSVLGILASVAATWINRKFDNRLAALAAEVKARDQVIADLRLARVADAANLKEMLLVIGRPLPPPEAPADAG